MSTADEGWDLTVPEDADELAAELRRHGVTPGQRLYIRFDVIQGIEVPAEGPEDSKDNQDVGRKLGFIASFSNGPPDLSIKTDEHLKHGFGR